MKRYLYSFVAMMLVLLLILGATSCKKENEADGDESSELVTEEESESEAPSDPPSEDESDGENKEGDEEGDEDKPTEQAAKQTLFNLNSESANVKLLGVRGLTSGSRINCDFPGSGIEMNVTLEGTEVTFQISATATCRFRVYVDGAEWKNTDESPYYTVDGNNAILRITGLTKGDHTLRLLRVTDAVSAQAHISRVLFAGSMREAPAQGARYIEFIGDELTGAKANEDITMLYSYKTALAMNADYSITAFAGQGLLCGDYRAAETYLLASPLRDATQQYLFARKATAAVVHIGAIDLADETVTAEAFQASYMTLLRTIRAKNGNACKLYCLYGAGGDRWNQAILDACEALGGEAAGIYTLELVANTDMTTALTELMIATENHTASPIQKVGIGTVVDWKENDF